MSVARVMPVGTRSGQHTDMYIWGRDALFVLSGAAGDDTSERCGFDAIVRKVSIAPASLCSSICGHRGASARMALALCRSTSKPSQLNRARSRPACRGTGIQHAGRAIVDDSGDSHARRDQRRVLLRTAHTAAAAKSAAAPGVGTADAGTICKPDNPNRCAPWLRCTVRLNDDPVTFEKRM